MATKKSYLFLGGKDRINPFPSGAGGPEFEFDEAEIWSSSNANDDVDAKRSIPNSRSLKKPGKKGASRAVSGTAMSLPVNVPDWSKILGSAYKNDQRESDDSVEDDQDDDDVDDEDKDSRIPPHEYLARTRTASFSVQEGIGRTLKGRDLSRVRNAIWKQTGFED